MRYLCLLLINFYVKLISPLLPARCRFYPTCSVYCYEAIEQYGIVWGMILAIKRLLRCHPLCDGGYDPVPIRELKKSTTELYNK